MCSNLEFEWSYSVDNLCCDPMAQGSFDVPMQCFALPLLHYAAWVKQPLCMRLPCHYCTGRHLIRYAANYGSCSPHPNLLGSFPSSLNGQGLSLSDTLLQSELRGHPTYRVYRRWREKKIHKFSGK